MAKKATAGTWFANQLWNTSLPWLGIVAFGMTGFYFLTNSKLDDHDKKFAAITAWMDKQTATAAETKRLDREDRDKVREAFLNDSRNTAQGIAELNKQTAVMGATLVIVQKELEKIGRRLEAGPSKEPR